MTDTLTLTQAQVNAIAAGRKTQHRHPARHDPDMRYRPCPFHPGQPVAIHAHGDKPDLGPRLHIEVTAAEIRTLREMTFPDVRAEGHKTTLDFMRDWLARHDHHHNPDGDDQAIQERFAARHAHRAVWVLTIQPAEPRRYLAARPDSIEAPYTTNPLRAIPGEPEAVSDTDLERLVTQAGAREQTRRADKYIEARITLERELAMLEDLNHRGIDNRVRLIRRNLRAIDQILKSDDQAA